MEEKKINGNLALNGKKRRVIRIEANHERDTQKLRVAAYCRVSSSSEDQLNSFAAQNIHYTQYISEHEDWRLVDIYADDTAIMGLNQNPVQTGVDLVPFFFLSALFSANEGVPA